MKLNGKEKFSYGLGAVGKDMVYMLLLSGYSGSERGCDGCDPAGCADL